MSLPLHFSGSPWCQSCLAGCSAHTNHLLHFQSGTAPQNTHNVHISFSTRNSPSNTHNVHISFSIKKSPSNTQCTHFILNKEEPLLRLWKQKKNQNYSHCSYSNISPLNMFKLHNPLWVKHHPDLYSTACVFVITLSAAGHFSMKL